MGAHVVGPVMSEAAPGALSGEAPAADDLKPLRLSSKKQPDVPSLNSAVEAALSSSRPGTASREVTLSAGMTKLPCIRHVASWLLPCRSA